MRQVSESLREHILSEVSTLCTCWRLERTDGVIYMWTDHDDDIMYDGELYLSASHGGFDRSALESSLGLTASDLELVGFLGGSLRKAEFTAGLFDSASLRVFMLNWMDPGMGALDLRSGVLGEVQTTNTDIYKVELRGLQQPYKQVVGEVYSPECRTNFCDFRCKLNLQDYTVAAEVTAVRDRRHFDIDINPTELVTAPEGAFNVGVVRFTSGLNAGRPIEIKSLSGTRVELKFAMPNLLEVGDTVDVSAGCDQRLEMCQEYDNVVNFRGEPFVPGNTAVYRILGGGE